MRKLYLAILILLHAATINAQNAGLDLSFAGKGYVQTGFGYHGLATQNTCNQVLLTPSGSFYLLFAYLDQTFLVRRLPNGALDNTYGENGYSVGAFVQNAQAVLMPDGSVVIGGSSFGNDLNWNFKLMRFLPNGKLDKTFAQNGIQLTDFHGEHDLMYTMALQPDNKIVTAGLSGYHFGVARYLPNGMLDNSFSQDGKDTVNFGGWREVPSGIAIKNDGRIVVVGQSVFGPENRMAVACFLSDGTRDNSFSGDGMNTFTFSNDCGANAVAVQPNGKIVMAGYINITYNEFAVVQLNADGSPDNSFSDDGVQTVYFTGWDEAFAVTIDNNGKIVAGGYGLNQWVVTRLNADGSLDLSMNGNGRTNIQIGLSNSRLYSLTIQPDGKILAGGEAMFGTTRYVAARFNATGSLDYTFGNGAYIADYKPSSGSSYNASAVQPDGKLITVGNTLTEGEISNVCIARYNTNGTLDNSFSGDGKLLFRFGTGASNATAMVIQPDGKILIGGSYHTSRQVGTNYVDIDFAVARLNEDGSFDNSFSGDGIVLTDMGGLDFLRSICLQPDGKIICGGTAIIGPPEGNTDSDFALVRYNADGSVDNSFANNGIVLSGLSLTDESIKKILLQPDGKIIAAGMLAPSSAPSELDFAIARYNANGTRDLSFNGTGMRTINISNEDFCNAAALNSNGAILLAGDSYDAGGGAQVIIVRVLANGQMDNSFSSDGIMTYGTNLTCNAMAIQPNGQIIAGGSRFLYPDHDGMIVRFNSDGSVDNTFSPDGIISTDLGEREQINSLSILNNRLYGVGQSSYDGSTGLVIAYSTSCNMNVSIPDAFAIPFGVDPNTVYKGYAPADDITLTARANGSLPFTYKWNTGATTKSIHVSPKSTTTYSVTVTDASGCRQQVSKKVNVVDVRCGHRGEKVLLCQVQHGKREKQKTICVDPWSATLFLLKGAHLGRCKEEDLLGANFSSGTEEKNTLGMVASPNPTYDQFTLNIKLKETKPAELIIRDIQGRIMDRKTIHSTSLVRIGSNYAPGIYIAELRQGENKLVIKIVRASR